MYEVRHDFLALAAREDGEPWIKEYRAELGKLMTPYQARRGWVNFVLGQRQESKEAVAKIIAADLVAQQSSDSIAALEFNPDFYVSSNDDEAVDDARGPADGYPDPNGR